MLFPEIDSFSPTSIASVAELAVEFTQVSVNDLGHSYGVKRLPSKMTKAKVASKALGGAAFFTIGGSVYGAVVAFRLIGLVYYNI